MQLFSLTNNDVCKRSIILSKVSMGSNEHGNTNERNADNMAGSDSLYWGSFY